MNVAMLGRSGPVFWRVRVIKPMETTFQVNCIVIWVVAPLLWHLTAQQIPEQVRAPLRQSHVSFKQALASRVFSTVL